MEGLRIEKEAYEFILLSLARSQVEACPERQAGTSSRDGC